MAKKEGPAVLVLPIGSGIPTLRSTSATIAKSQRVIHSFCLWPHFRGPESGRGVARLSAAFYKIKSRKAPSRYDNFAIFCDIFGKFAKNAARPIDFWQESEKTGSEVKKNA